MRTHYNDDYRTRKQAVVSVGANNNNLNISHERTSQTCVHQTLGKREGIILFFERTNIVHCEVLCSIV